MKKDLARILPVVKHMSVTYKPSPGVKLLGMLKKRVEPCRILGSYIHFRILEAGKKL